MGNTIPNKQFKSLKYLRKMATFKIVSVFLVAVCVFGLASSTDIDLMKMFDKCGGETGVDMGIYFYFIF